MRSNTNTNLNTKAAARSRAFLLDRKESTVRPTHRLDAEFPTRGAQAHWADEAPWRDTPSGSGRHEKRRSARAERRHGKLIAWTEALDD